MSLRARADLEQAAPAPTFRDPAGSLRLQGEYAIRSVHPGARQNALRFLHSPFYARMVERGDIVPSDFAEDAPELVLRHPRLEVPTYPWEWTSTQWLAAASLTLDLCQEGLAEGWMLKDATPLNILFNGTRPVLVDVLSFEPRDPTSSLWLAYGQYTRTFLLPLVMHRLLHWPFALTFFHRDGYEPAELYRSLTWAQRLSGAALWPITLPAWLDRRKGGAAPTPAAPRPRDPELTAHILGRTLRDLRRRTLAVAGGRKSASEWSDYPDTLTHYSADDTRAKKSWVTEILRRCAPARVLDIGANTGEYSLLAAEVGASVVALERDAAAADRLFRRTREAGAAIRTIHADLARPTPAAGWENRETLSLLDRLEGRFGLVLALAVIHHLILMEQIPLPAILALLARLSSRFLILEWVPSSDPMFQSLMRGRDSLYGHLAQHDLLDAAAPHFHLIDQHALGNGRILHLFEKSSSGQPA